jgi:nitrile hydratase accessory protein
MSQDAIDPRSGDAPVFREPWEAHAFAMVVELHGRGLFTWREWADALAAQIAAAQAAGDADRGGPDPDSILRAA